MIVDSTLYIAAQSMDERNVFYITASKEVKTVRDYQNYFTENSVQIPKTEYSTLGVQTNLR